MNGRGFVHVLFIIAATIAGGTVARVLALEGCAAVLTSRGYLNTRQGILTIVAAQVAGAIIGALASACWAWHFTKPRGG
jgi:hypothetical protein